MVVTCEFCNTKFRIDPDRLRKPRSKVRCSVCRHVFVVTQQEEEVLEIDLEEDLELPARVSLESSDSPIPTPPQGPGPSSARAQESSRGKRLLIWLAVVLALAAGVLGISSYLTSRSPDTADQGTPQTPSIKVLDTTQAFFLENAHAGQIFVIEGEVENQSTKPVSFILVEGKLFNTTNRVAITQRCYVGNTMTRDELSRLNITEIQNHMMNREGKSLSNVKIPPAKRVPFMLVFHNLPELKALSDYSVEMISSKFD